MHPLVTQLQFARSEFIRSLEGVSDADARKRLGPMNAISWNIGHLAVQEQAYWLILAQEENLYPDLYKLVGNGSPPSTPPLDEMWQAWTEITQAADLYLATVTTETLQTFFERKGKIQGESVGTMLLRNIYHYWYHCGEVSAVRQSLGHTDLPQFVGNMSTAVYGPE
jgi:uncharacterized damage-inducible protein DinB